MAEKAALYLRSTKDRHDISVESQRGELTNYCRSGGATVVATFEDRVQSAKTDQRPRHSANVLKVGLAEQKGLRHQKVSEALLYLSGAFAP
ncbi:recombinase family protein [Spiribacter halobius]|uniref:Resolvase/invertase-type recombinase catalytic domain-containing protein n=1 Tax=Sediminicurvatus halobius TaxID=2182432 RepID=A0A2U2MXW7_9GAMM|nr:recombinase family protein [Spiribacter halobius]PWG61514.1 hypothetical protein DEM34_15920 [Spiribacter halobius]UEX77993.1 recombinase family protein [Spiribacter halobius]